MLSVIIICFINASSNLTLQCLAVLPPWDAGNTGWGVGIHNHAFLQQEALTLLVK